MFREKDRREYRKKDRGEYKRDRGEYPVDIYAEQELIKAVQILSKEKDRKQDESPVKGTHAGLHLKNGSYEIIGKMDPNRQQFVLQIKKDHNILGWIHIKNWKSLSVSGKDVWDSKIDGRPWRKLLFEDSNNPRHKNRHFTDSNGNIVTKTLDSVVSREKQKRPRVITHYCGYSP